MGANDLAWTQFTSGVHWPFAVRFKYDWEKTRSPPVCPVAGDLSVSLVKRKVDCLVLSESTPLF